MTKFPSARTLQAIACATLAFLLGAGTVLPQGRATTSRGPQTDSVVVVYRDLDGTSIQMRNSNAVQVCNRAALIALWKRFGGIQPAPSIDFRKGSVLVVGAGALPTTGYELVIRNVQTRSNEIAVHADLNAPGFGCVTGQEVTYPLVIAQFVGRRTKMPQPPVHLYLTRVREPRCAP